MKLLVFIFIISCQTAQAGLLGTDLGLELVFQQTPSDPLTTAGPLTTATVTEPAIEFPSIKALATTNPQVADVAINAGDYFLEIDFDNVTPALFTPAFLNAYVFTFDNIATMNITNALIDSSVTTLGLTLSDIIFSGNQLTVNVESLPFNTSSFVRINLSASPVPVPAAVWLFGSAMIGLLGMGRQRTV